MQIIPSYTDNNHALYSVVPLSLDITNMSNYLEVLDTSYGDCQLFSSQELDNNMFFFGSEQYKILADGEIASSSKHRKAIELPFNFLLAGPTYACKEVMKSFPSWALYPPSIGMGPHAHKNRRKRKGGQEQSLGSVWHTVRHPSVWAQATFTGVTVTTLFPDLLKKELLLIFDFPISVVAVAPALEETHNELCAWLTAIYALILARNLCRTVFCHSHFWRHQLQLYSRSRSPLDDVSASWRSLVYFDIPVAHPKLPKKNEMIAYAKKLSQYEIKRESFAREDLFITTRQMGIGYIETLFSNFQAYHTLFGDAALCDILYVTNSVHIGISVNIPQYIKETIKRIVAEKLQISIQNINIICKNTTSTVLVTRIDLYSLFCNAAIVGCSKIAKTKKKSKVEVALKDIVGFKKYRGAVCTVLEFKKNKLDSRMALTRAYMVLDIGQVYHSAYLNGVIEKKIYDVLFSICGGSVIKDNMQQIHIEYKNSSGEKDYVVSYLDLVYHSVYFAAMDAIHADYQLPNTHTLKKATYG